MRDSLTALMSITIPVARATSEIKNLVREVSSSIVGIAHAVKKQHKLPQSLPEFVIESRMSIVVFLSFSLDDCLFYIYSLS